MRVGLLSRGGRRKTPDAIVRRAPRGVESAPRVGASLIFFSVRISKCAHVSHLTRRAGAALLTQVRTMRRDCWFSQASNAWCFITTTNAQSKESLARPLRRMGRFLSCLRQAVCNALRSYARCNSHTANVYSKFVHFSDFPVTALTAASRAQNMAVDVNFVIRFMPSLFHSTSIMPALLQLAPAAANAAISKNHRKHHKLFSHMLSSNTANASGRRR